MPTLEVPGATRYDAREGTGPVLLMVPGGPADGGVFAALAGLLTDRYAVVPYDPRGNSRSGPDDRSKDQDMDVHGDHDGFGSRPGEFAKTLHQVLGG